MATNMLITLAKALIEADNLPWEYSLYVPISNLTWQQDMPVMVLDPEEVDGSDDDPSEAHDNGLTYALTVSSLQDVVRNARDQGASTNLDLLIKALKYYYDNDSFITLK